MRFAIRMFLRAVAFLIGTVTAAVILVALFAIVVSDIEFENTGLQKVAEQRLEEVFGADTIAVESASIGLGRQGLNLTTSFRYRREDGSEIVFPVVKSTLSLSGLLTGSVRLKSLDVAGLEISIVASESGRFALPPQFAKDFSTTASPGTLVDEVLASSPLGGLARIALRETMIVLENPDTGKRRRIFVPLANLLRSDDRIGLRARVRHRSETPEQDLEMDISVTRVVSSGTLEVEARVHAPDGDAIQQGEAVGAAALGQLGLLPVSSNLVFPDPSPDVVRSVDSTRPEFPFDLYATTEKGEIEATGVVTFEVNADTGEVGSIGLKLPTLSAVVNSPREPAGLFEIEKGGLDLILFPASRRIELNRAWISDDESLLQTNGWLDFTSRTPRARFRVDADRISADRASRHWPDGIASGARNWMDTNLSAGDALDVAGDVSLGDNGLEFDFRFDFDDAEFSILRGLPHVRAGAGSARLVNNSLTIAFDSGSLGDPDFEHADISGSRLEIRSRSGSRPTARIALKSSSSVGFLLRNVDFEAIGVPQANLLATDKVSGDARISGSITLPLGQTGREDVTYAVNTRLSDLRLQLPPIPGMADLPVSDEIESESLVIRSDNRGTSISGPIVAGDLGGDLSWTMKNDKSQPDSNLMAIDLDLDTKHFGSVGLGFLEGNVSGLPRMRVEVDLDAPDGRTVTVTSPLEGLSMSFPELGWEKPASEKAWLVVVVNLDADDIDYKVRFAARGLAFETVLRPGGGAAGVRLDNFELGKWLTTSVIILHDSGGIREIVLDGGTLDMSEAQFKGGVGSGQPVVLAVELDNVLVSDRINLTEVSGRLEPIEGKPAEFTALVNGSVPISGTLLSRPVGQKITIRTEDAGELLRQTGYFKSAIGGTMNVEVTTQSESPNIDLVFSIRSTRVRDAPTLAAVLNAISVVGLLQQLAGPGLRFSSVKGKAQIKPNLVSISGLSGVGSSIAISLDGWYRPESREVNFVGVVSPVNLVTGVLETTVGNILKILTGPGRGDKTFGFNYKIRGHADDPAIDINPLSILTPGRFREIFGSEIPEPPPDAN